MNPVYMDYFRALAEQKCETCVFDKLEIVCSRCRWNGKSKYDPVSWGEWVNRKHKGG